MQLSALAAFSDNYIWALHDQGQALVVDPGDAGVVQAWLNQHGLQLDSILLTHHHPDHTAGVAALRSRSGARVYGPAKETLPEPVQRLVGGQGLRALGLDWQVIDVPGHTAGHIAYFLPQLADAEGTPLLFCGDTLFSGGCGRLFEGTAAQMWDSLSRLARLPDATRVCCAHEYTLSNLAFASAIEPDSADLAEHLLRCQGLRAAQQPTLPSSIGLEKRINPFLRCHEPSVIDAVCRQEPHHSALPADVLASLRQRKNQF